MSFCLSIIIENIKSFAENVLRVLVNIFNLNVIISSIITLIMLFFIFKNRKIIISYGKKINILNIIKSIFRFIHKYYIMSFIILFILSAVAFSLIYFGHSKKIENRFDNALKNYEETMKNIITNIVIINETNKYISTNSFKQNIDNTVNNKIVINNNSQNDTAEYLKMSFEVSFDILKNSITVIMKDSNDILQFWFAFLSVIMIVFTLIGFFVSSNILNQAREQLEIIKEKSNILMQELNSEYNKSKEDVEIEAKNSTEKIKIETERLIEENNKNIQENNLFNLGLQAYNNGDYQSSIHYFNEVIKLNSKNYQAYNNRGLAKYYLKDYEVAIKDYDEAIRLNPNYSIAYNNRGIAKAKLGKLNEAIDDYNDAIRLNSNYSEAYNNRGNAKSNLANTKEKNSEEYNKLINEAIDDYNEAIRLNTNFTEAYNNRGIVKAELKLFEEAIEDYNKAIELNPNFSEAYNNRGNAKSNLANTKEKNSGEYNQLIEEAIKDFITAYELDNNNEAKEKSKNQLAELADKSNRNAKEFCEKYNIDYKIKNDNKDKN